ncbi:response regulator transcription factor [Aquibacillus saliphilus]|uniref:response regulator transcription factor n=1 Tax=Aquibacillus saliphilus TaxID=1909422 RepID=UPI001CEFB1C1|nr:response regulator [Aquibacillus saliphilus]
MTYKMLIVDDEPIICRGLASTIPWKDYNIEVIDIAHDGDDAVNKIKKHDGIDLVITDVRMPNKDGLQLASHIYENYPETKVIIISGYDDFKYAQQAIHLGVKDYLLKPVDINELLKVIEKVTEEMKESRLELQLFRQSNLINAIYHRVLDYSGEVTEELLALEDERIYPFLSLKKNYLAKTRCMKEEDLKAFKLEWKNSVEDFLESQQLTSVSIFISENILLTCIREQEGKLLKRDLVSIANDTASDQWLFVCNETGVMLKDINQITKQLIENIKYFPISKRMMVIGSEVEQQNRIVYPIQIENDLIQAIMQFDQKKISKHTNELFDYFQSERFLIEETVSISNQIIVKIVNRLKALLQKEPNPIHFLFDKSLDVLLCNSYYLLQELFEQDIEKIVSEFELKDIDNKDWLMNRAIDYINSYYKSEIKAQEVADVINISPNYFSSLFKQKTGKNFNEYVNYMRVEEAKQLLVETPFKVSEISEQVGFHEYKYFVEVFKKFSGMTPTKYRKFITIEKG